MAHKSKKIVMCLALLGAGFCAAWLRVRPHLEHEGRYTDGSAVYDTSSGEAVRYVVWDAPEPLAGAVNTDAAERAGTSSPDGRLFVFAVGSPGLDMDLYAADIVDGRTVEPRRIDPLCSAGDECAPAFDGDTLYFASNRPGGAGGFDIYRAQRVGDGFAQPELLPPPVNGPHDDVDPAPLASHGEIVFASDRGGAGFDLYTASLFATSSGVRALDELNTPQLEREPTFTPDGRALVWSSERDGGRGLADLYQSFAREGTWTPPEALTALCTESDERSPHLAADGFTLYFARSDADAPPDLFRTRTIELYRIPSRPIGWIEILTIAALLVLALLAYLAQRWPSIDTIYKCFLISVLVHLALLWWTSRVLMESGGIPADRPLDRIRIRIERGESPALTERAGTLPSERSIAALDDSAGPTRVALEARKSDEAPPESIALQAADADGNAAPARAGASFGPAEAAIANTRLADSEGAAPTRGGRAQELALETPKHASTRDASGDAGPTRGALAHASGAALGEPAPGEIAIARSENDLGASTDASERTAAEVGRGGSVAQSTPLADARDSSGSAQRRSGSATELALDAPTSAPTRNAIGDAGPTRGAIAHASGAAVAEPAPGEIAIARSELDLGASTGASERTAADAGRAASAHSAVPLAEPSAAAGESRRRDTAPARDLLADLAPQHTPASAPVSASSNPERWQARDSTDTTPHQPSAPLVVSPAPVVAESPQPSTRQRSDHTPYQNRSGEEKLRALEMHGGSRETEQAVERGLAYLARIQRSRGHWGDMSDVDEKYGELAIGKTGLCMLAFLGAGHTHRSSTPYSPVVAKALRALLEAQDDASGHFGDSEAYGHAIATFALTECLALSGDDALRAPLERAVAHILAQQSKRKDPRFLGGWGYYYPDDRTFDRWPRTSITVWQVMALESARLSGIQVPDAAFADARAFLQHAHDESQGFVRYNHDPERLNSGYPTLPASTPAALFALSLLGADIKSAQLADLRSFTLERAPSGYRYAGDDAFVHRAQGNLYFWYYGTLAAFRIGGASWQTWNEAMKRTLLPAQSPDGSWKPIDIYAKYARDTSEDRAYTTAMCVLSLEIYYRYFLPLLKVH